MKKALYVLGWSLTLLGLLVVLAATVHYMVRAGDLEAAWIVASVSSDVTKAESLSGEIAQLSARPGILLGASVTVFGIVALLVRRRIEAQEEARFLGSPLGLDEESPARVAPAQRPENPVTAAAGVCPHCRRPMEAPRDRTWVDAWAERYSTDPDLRERMHRLLAQVEERDQRGLPPPNTLRRRLRDKMDQDQLPRDLPEKIVLGLSGGEICDACDEPVLPAQMLNTLQTSDGRLFRLHVGCLAAWKSARRRRASKPSRDP